MSREAVLALLKDSGDAYVSGQVISQQLGVSRAAVWKSIEALRKEGYLVASFPRKGYRLMSSPDRIRSGELTDAVAGGILGRNIVCLDSVDSTNLEIKRRAMDGTAEGLVVISEEQTGGRGRQGRTFQSPKGKGLYLSALLRPPLAPNQILSITAWTAVAVCNAIEEACGVRPGIKWTNDIILEGKKICGILTEMEVEGESGALNSVVVGIGVNVNEVAKDFAPEVRSVAASLSMVLGKQVRRSDVASCLIRALDRMYADFLTGQKEFYLARYRADCVTLGREVQFLLPDGEVQAFAQDIDDEFSLVVEYGDGSVGTIFSGEVSVRGINGYL